VCTRGNKFLWQCVPKGAKHAGAAEQLSSFASDGESEGVAVPESEAHAVANAGECGRRHGVRAGPGHVAMLPFAVDASLNQAG
jgi:hypothetical protein